MPACRSARCRSTTRSRSTSAGRSWTRRDATPRRSGQKYEASGTEDILELMVKKLERFGRKNGKGFYDYPADGKKRLWPELAKALPGRSRAALRRGRGQARQGDRDQEAPALRAGGRHRALPGSQRADRAAGRRCRLDHGPGLRAADRRRHQPDRPGRREAVRRRVRRVRQEVRAAVRGAQAAARHGRQGPELLRQDDRQGGGVRDVLRRRPERSRVALSCEAERRDDPATRRRARLQRWGGSAGSKTWPSASSDGSASRPRPRASSSASCWSAWSPPRSMSR